MRRPTPTRPSGFYRTTFSFRTRRRFTAFTATKCCRWTHNPPARTGIWPRSSKAGATFVTQNIDGLHQKAGSRRVYELHGSIYRNHCLQCGLSAAPEQIRDSEDVPRCPRCGGLIKPDVVLYGEPLDEAVLRAAIDAIARADLLIVGGTSLTVYPAAGLLDEFRGDSLVVINRTPTAADHRADLLISEPIGEVLQSLIPHIPAPPRGKSRP